MPLQWVCKQLFFYPLYLQPPMPLLQSLMMVRQETGVLVAEPFVHLITSNNLSYHQHLLPEGEQTCCIPFAANDVFRIMEITFTPFNFTFTPFHLLSIWPCSSCGINPILKKFFHHCWAVKKIVKKQGAICLFQFFRQLHHHTLP